MALNPSPMHVQKYRSRYLPAMGLAEIAALPDKEWAPVIVATGAIEQHGPHLPLGVDAYISTGVSQRVALALRPDAAVVAPALAYGYKSVPCMGGGPFPGTLGLDASTLVATLRDIVRELARDGVRRVIVLVGHFENQMFAVEGVNLALRDAVAAGVDGLEIMRLEYWDFIHAETLAKVFPGDFPGVQLEHAAVMETSMMLALKPGLVDVDAIPGAGRQPADRAAAFPSYTIEPAAKRAEWAPASGVLSPALGASAQKGEWLLGDHVAGIVAAIQAEWPEFAAPK